jgi:two-component system response regulator FixJ
VEGVAHVVASSELRRGGIVWFLQSAGRTAVGHADLEACAAALAVGEAAAIVLDLGAAPDPASARLAAWRELGRQQPVVGLLTPCSMFDAVALLHAGAWTLLDATGPPELLLAAIERALVLEASAAPARQRTATFRAQLATLTSRERDVVLHLALGQSGKDVAVALGISPHTVEVHRTRILGKMGATSMLDLAVRMAEAGELR